MSEDKIVVKNLSIGYGENIIIQNADFSVKNGDVFIIMGGSGCGKSTMLKVLTGLLQPLNGKFFIDDVDYLAADDDIKFEPITNQ